MNEAKQRAEHGRAALTPIFYGYDSHGEVLHKALANSERAGFGELIRFDRQPVNRMIAPKHDFGLVVCNMPYNQRLQADSDLYKEMGVALKTQVPLWNAVLLCGNDDLAYATGLRAKKKYAFFNGAIECVLLTCTPIYIPRVESSEPKVLSEGAVMVMPSCLTET